MNEKVLHTVEFEKVLHMLEDCADSGLGKESCRKLRPVTEKKEICIMQRETSDALTYLLTRGSVGFQGVKDIGDSLKRLEIGAVLGMKELLDISGLLNNAGSVKKYFRDSLNEEEETGDSLNEYYQGLEPLSPLMNEIRRCILAEDEVADDASAGLHHIRRKLKGTADKIHEQLNRILNAKRQMLQDGLITMRSGRYCLPVKAEYRNSFSGMLHDQSATGATLFIEPEAVVKLNNEIRDLELKEQEEIEKILSELSEQAAQYIPEMEGDFQILKKLDFIFAKAKLSKKMQGTAPQMDENGVIRIKKGRHPLIPKDKVVPIDLTLGEDFSLLIVTGPNTGGKTVSLKTVGLFTLMGQAGLHIPAFDGSSLRIFEEVYADIGDEQSIEQSLSTFSSHMVNTVSILKKADYRSLVLFDELGAGTDPVEGAALATAILSDLHERGAVVMATTHYSELKLYALQTPDVENACCEFDVASLKPTYRLLIGIPGKSNAFAISGKLGLSEKVIEDAKRRVASDAQAFEDVLNDLEVTRDRLEKEKNETVQIRKEVDRLKKELREKNEKIEQRKEKILSDANEEAGRILEGAKAYADETIRKYTKWAKSDQHIREMEAERTKLREEMNKTEKGKGEKKQKKVSKTKASELFIGADVRVLSLGCEGTVSTLPNAQGELYVQAGLLRTKVSLEDIELLKKETEKKTKQAKAGGSIRMNKGMHIHQEINLIGMTVDEAMPVLGKYLDDAYLAHLKEVRVIHGRGTGALRKGVHDHLKRTKYVKSYRLGEFGEGDMGVTIVEFQ